MTMRMKTISKTLLICTVFAASLVAAAAVGFGPITPANSAIVAINANGAIIVDENDITDAHRDAYLTDIQRRYVSLLANETAAMAQALNLNIDQFEVINEKTPRLIGPSTRNGGRYYRVRPHAGNTQGFILADSGPHARLVAVPQAEAEHEFVDGGNSTYFRKVPASGAGDSLVHPIWGVQAHELGAGNNFDEGSDSFVRQAREAMVNHLRQPANRASLDSSVHYAIWEFAQGIGRSYPTLLTLLLNDPSYTAIPTHYRPPPPPPPTPPIPPALAPQSPPAPKSTTDPKKNKAGVTGKKTGERRKQSGTYRKQSRKQTGTHNRQGAHHKQGTQRKQTGTRGKQGARRKQTGTRGKRGARRKQTGTRGKRGARRKQTGARRKQGAARRKQTGTRHNQKVHRKRAGKGRKKRGKQAGSNAKRS